MKTLLTIFGMMLSVSTWAFEYPQLQTIQTFYVSSSEGQDGNPGTIDRPLKSLSSLTTAQRRNANVYLRCGDIFYESLRDFEGCNIDAYGVGENPVLCGFRILENKAAWEAWNDSVWRLDLTRDQDFSGFMASAASNRQTYTAVGLIYQPATGRIFGNLVQRIDSMKREGDFWQTEFYQRDSLSDGAFRYLYFKSGYAPGQLGRLCFSVAEQGVWKLVNCRLANISVVGFARHGVLGLYDTLVENCKVDMIGGSVLLNYSKWSRYGNGIELNISGNSPSVNVMVQNCQITRTYDSGITIQGTNRVYHDAVNLHFTGNRIAYCRQGFEWYLVAPKDFDPSYVDCSVEGNLFFENGDNHFGIPRYGNECQLLSYEHRIKDMPITDNTFYGSNYYCGYRFGQGRHGNTVYIWRGQYLNGWIGYKTYPAIFANSPEDAEAYSSRCLEKSSIIILDRNSDEDKRIRKELWEELSLSYPVLNL